MEIKNNRLFVIILSVMLVVAAVLLVADCVWLSFENSRLKAQLKTQETNAKSLYFAQLFVSDFLLSDKTVGFDERLKLENAVRDIQDTEIINKWQGFTDSKDNAQAQKAAGELLNLLLNKM